MPLPLLTVTDFVQGIRRPACPVCVAPGSGGTGEGLFVDATACKATNSAWVASVTSAPAGFAPAASFHLSLMVVPA